MEDKILIQKLKELKERNRYTLFDLSKLLDLSVTTIERWLRTCRINRLYAQRVKERLGLG